MNEKGIGVYLDYEKKITTLDVPHEKIVLDKVYYFGKMPEGDYRKHYHDSSWEDGYGRRHVSFLMKDGLIETVKGPFSCDGMFEHGASNRLAKALGNPELLLVATRLIVGRNLFKYPGSKTPEIIFREEEMTTKPIAERIRPEWSGLELEIQKRDGSNYKRVDDFLNQEVI